MRSTLAAGGLMLGLAGLVGASWHNSVGAQANDITYDIWITADGFNPASCTIRRGDNARWVNKTSTVRNVTFDHLRMPGQPNVPYTTGDIAPGGSSSALSFDFIGSNEYHELYEPGFTGAVGTTDSGVASCSQIPPTPTPTATPSVSPTPTATPTPPRHPACDGGPGCAVVPEVAKDE